MALSLARVEYVCKPYYPTESCDTGRYEVDLYENKEDRHPIGRVFSKCVQDLGPRYRAVDVTFMHRYSEEDHDELELPKRYTKICKYE